MEQLRQDVQKFKDLDTEIVVVAPDILENALRFFSRFPVPFTALVDESLEVFQQYDVQSKLLSLGQRPGLFIIDQTGTVRFAYIGEQQWEIPENELVLEKLMEISETELITD